MSHAFVDGFVFVATENERRIAFLDKVGDLTQQVDRQIANLIRLAGVVDRRRFGNSKKASFFLVLRSTCTIFTQNMKIGGVSVKKIKTGFLFCITLNLHYLCHSINVFGYGDSFKEIACWHTGF